MEEATILSDFYSSIWKETKGYVYLALKNPETNDWEQRFYEYPNDLSEVVSTTLSKRDTHDVYYAPSLFSEKSSKKENVIGANVFWIEFDGSAQVDLSKFPEPSLVVQSSDVTHKHIYWFSEELIQKDILETINRSLTYELGADASGWDANQVLRPPLTINHKKNKSTKLICSNDNTVQANSFRDLITVDPPPLGVLPKDIPSAKAVYEKYKSKLPGEVLRLLKDGVEYDRSAGLMALGYGLAEHGLSNPEMLSLLYLADGRWGKFSKRTDRSERLFEIVLRARIKFPEGTVSPVEVLELVDLLTFLASEITLEWVWQDLLQQDGYLLLTGPTATGKTQVSLNFAASAALGNTFLNKEISTSKKVAFISLEMNGKELQFFLQKQMMGYSEEQKQMIAKNLLLLPLGYPIYFNREPNRKSFEELVERYELDGVIFDSLGSMTGEELSKESTVKEIMDWNDYLRNKYNIFTWIIHHHRKSQGQNKKPNRIDDVYGNQYITARATTVLGLWSGKSGIDVLPLKIRLAERPNPFTIVRDKNLNFTVGSIQKWEEVDVSDAATTEYKELEEDSF